VKVVNSGRENDELQPGTLMDAGRENRCLPGRPIR